MGSELVVALITVVLTLLFSETSHWVKSRKNRPNFVIDYTNGLMRNVGGSSATHVVVRNSEYEELWVAKRKRGYHGHHHLGGHNEGSFDPNIPSVIAPGETIDVSGMMLQCKDLRYRDVYDRGYSKPIVPAAGSCKTKRTYVSDFYRKTEGMYDSIKQIPWRLYVLWSRFRVWSGALRRRVFGR